jgi:glycerophosphoryl diester phosphodiesterase
LSRRREASDIAWLTARPIAHRGLHDATARRVENTLPAFEAAIAHGFAIECDVREAADHETVIFHDETLDRLTAASGAVSRKSLGELRAARFKAGDARIPTLEELLDLVDGRVPLVIEMKTAGGEQDRLAAIVADVLSTYDGPVAVMSFDPGGLSVFRRLAPQLPRGIIVGDFTESDNPSLSAIARFSRRHLLAAPFLLPRFVACDRRRLPAAAPLLLRQFLGLPLLVWTIRSAIEQRAARAWADQIIFEGFDPDASPV